MGTLKVRHGDGSQQTCPNKYTQGLCPGAWVEPLGKAKEKP